MRYRVMQPSPAFFTALATSLTEHGHATTRPEARTLYVKHSYGGLLNAIDTFVIGQAIKHLDATAR